MFLGYKPTYKGYLCYYISSKRFYISRHVIFNEYVFPFKTSNKVPKHKQLITKLLFTTYLDFLLADGVSLISEVVTPTINNSTPSLYDQDARSIIMEKVLHVDSPVSSTHSDQLPQRSQTNVVSSHPMTMRFKFGIIKPNPRYALTDVVDNIF